MKKQMLIPFLCGLVVPLVMLGILVRMEKDPQEQEKETTLPAREKMISVQQEDGQVEQMKLQEYLVRVVLAEMPTSFPEEALKAQAVVARTYGFRRQESGDRKSVV